MITTLLTESGLVGMHVDNARSVVWLVRDDGVVLTTDLAGDAAKHQQLAGVPVDIAGAKTILAVVLDDGSAWTLDPDAPAAPAVPIATFTAAPTQITVSPTGKSILAAVGGAGERASIATGAVTASALPAGASGVAALGTALAVATNHPVTGVGRLRRLGGLWFGTASTPVAELGRAGASADATVVFGASPATNTVIAWEPATAATSSGDVVALSGTVIEVQGLADGRIVVLTDQVLAIVDSLADLTVTLPPSITAPAKPLFVASWVRLDYDLGTSGLTAADITFAVPDGPDAGIVSHTRENGATEPSPILVAGGRLGTYKVVMIETATNTEIASAEFTVTNDWDDADTGPSRMITGIAGDFAGDSGWGGGPSTPQNLGDLPHTGNWDVLIMLVDTSTARWPAATLAQSQTDVLNHAINGFSVGGTNRSAKLYYDENSSNQLTLVPRNSATFGPVAMPNAWTSYFAQTVDAMGNVTDDRWAPKGSSWQAFLTQAINDGDVTTADLQAVDSVIFVPFSPDASPAAGDRFAWPYGDIGKQSMLLGTNVMTDQGQLACVQVPLDFSVHDGSGRHAHATLSHELGHNLGLLDVYNTSSYSAEVSGRITSDWEMMAGSRNTLPHYTISNKMRMGWVPAAQLQLFNFSGAGGVDQNVTLHAAELGSPPAGRVRGIEIRLGDGWNYYIEYRSEQSGFISDDVPTDRRVVLTDVTSENFSPPIQRPRILFVPDDIDADGRILGVSSDFTATDPGTGFELEVSVVSTDEDNAVVRVRYGSNGRPDLGIQPWDNGPTWQSPDIEVRNDKNAADVSLFNVPWAGRPNTVVAKVHNYGDFPATGVRAEIFVTEYSAGDGPWVSLGTVTKNVAALAAEEFTVGWNPSADESKHYCIIVRIAAYEDPGNPAIDDTNIFNQEARSNYTRFISASASPSTRVGASVLLSNPYAETTKVTARVRQTHPLHRAFIDHQWLTVDPGTPRAITVLDEALLGTAEWPYENSDDRRWQKRLWGRPNFVSVDGWARIPQTDDCIGRVPTGGACLSVQAARETRTLLREAWPHGAHGEVEFVDDGTAVPDHGVVLVEIGGDRETWTVTTQTFGGKFRTELPQKAEVRWVIAHYLGGFGAAASQSDRADL
jgi:M6 family metalloprotease-like protein